MQVCFSHFCSFGWLVGLWPLSYTRSSVKYGFEATPPNSVPPLEAIFFQTSTPWLHQQPVVQQGWVGFCWSHSIGYWLLAGPVLLTTIAKSCCCSGTLIVLTVPYPEDSLSRPFFRFFGSPSLSVPSSMVFLEINAKNYYAIMWGQL